MMGTLLVYSFGLIITLLLLYVAQKYQGEENLAFSIRYSGGVIYIDKSFLLVVLAFMPLWYLISFRDLSVGVDAGGTQYNIYRYISQGVFYDFANFGDEIGYFILNKICFLLSDSYHFVLITTGTISWALFYTYIINNSCDPVFSIILLFLSFGYFHQFNIMRQFIACGIILFGFKYIRNRELIKYIITIAIAFTFHKIAVLGIVLYFLYEIKINTKLGIVMIVLSKLGMIILRPAVERILNGTRYYKILYDNEAYKTGYLLLEIVVCLIIYVTMMLIENDENFETDEEYNFNIWLQIFCMIIVFNSNLIPIPYRILWYFNINNPVFLAQMIDCYNKKIDRQILRLVFIVVYFAYFLYEWNIGTDGVQSYSLWKS